VSARTALVNAARGLVKSYGQRLPNCGTQQVSGELAAGLNAELREILEPLLKEIESLNERIQEYEVRIEKIAKESYPQVELLKQVKGVGTQIALTYVLTLEDPPFEGPFTQFVAFDPQDSLLVFAGGPGGVLGLQGIDTLVGYTGGPIRSFIFTIPANPPFFNIIYEGDFSALTVTPEPNSGVLWLLAVGLMFVMRKRIGRGLPQAS
jgi:hypothetical protein